MNFVRFLENRFQELTVENEKFKDAFNVGIDSEIKATHDLLTTYRTVVKWVMMPKVIVDFILVKLGLKIEPQPVLLNRMKETREAKKAADAILAESKVTPIKSEPQTTA
jgi:hypothetical protein